MAYLKRPRVDGPVMLLCYADKLPLPQSEFRFAPPRRWRFDYAWPEALLAVEVDGSVWTQGRHTRGQGYLADIEKLNTAAALGWTVFRTTPQTIHLLRPFLLEMLR